MDEKAMREKIDRIFEGKDNQGSAIVAVYKAFVPDWDKIEKLDGWPKCGKPVWQYIAKKFQELDEKYHPSCIPGGVWLNNGFSANHENDPNLGDWEVNIDDLKIIWKEGSGALSEDRIEELAREMYQWYQNCGCDLFVNDEGRHDGSITFTGKDLADIAADHMPADFLNAPTLQRQEIKRKAFVPDQEYGY